MYPLIIDSEKETLWDVGSCRLKTAKDALQDLIETCLMMSVLNNLVSIQFSRSLLQCL